MKRVFRIRLKIVMSVAASVCSVLTGGCAGPRQETPPPPVYGVDRDPTPDTFIEEGPFEDEPDLRF